MPAELTVEREAKQVKVTVLIRHVGFHFNIRHLVLLGQLWIKSIININANITLLMILFFLWIWSMTIFTLRSRTRSVWPSHQVLPSFYSNTPRSPLQACPMNLPSIGYKTAPLGSLESTRVRSNSCRVEESVSSIQELMNCQEKKDCTKQVYVIFFVFIFLFFCGNLLSKLLVPSWN